MATEHLDPLEIWDFGRGCYFWPEQAELLCPEGKDSLDATERNLLLVLVRNAGKLVTYSQIASEGWQRAHVEHGAIHQAKRRLCRTAKGIGWSLSACIESRNNLGYLL